jgi:hypothetical protein
VSKFKLFCFLFINFNLFAYSQVIKGTIKDKITDKAICFAAVYFDGTFVGTQSDTAGNFELTISSNSSMPLIISCVGYYSVTQPVTTGKPLLIYLTPKTYGMDGVVVSSKSLVGQRKKNLILFKNVFLGTTANAKLCYLLNEKDITFNYGSDDDTLKAYASKPILISNKGLGYKLTYFLDKFEYYKKDSSFLFKGNFIFIEDLINDETQPFQRKREMAYLGSRMHFFRALWANKLVVAGFTVKDSFGEYLNYENIVVKENLSPFGPLNISTKLLTSGKNMQISYYSNLTQIVFLKPKVFFDENGYFDQLGIFWDGDMALQRIGDMLPFDYEIYYY